MSKSLLFSSCIISISTVLTLVAASVESGFFLEAPLPFFFGFQGILALFLSVILGLPSWWWFFNSGFLWLSFNVLSLNWPPYYFLLAFCSLYLLFSGNSASRVPFFPTRFDLRKQIASAIPSEVKTVLDLGSGFGGWNLSLHQYRPELQLTGVELALIPWIISLWRARQSGQACRFIRANYQHLDWSEYDVVYAYLSPLVMDDVWYQACQQMRPGSYLMSYAFNADTTAVSRPHKLIDSGLSDLYIWQMGAHSHMSREQLTC